MKNVKLQDVNGTQVNGEWNGKTYSSKVAECVRIYLSNKEYTVNKSSIEAIINEDEYMKNESKKEKRTEILKSLTKEEQLKLFEDLFYNSVQEQINDVDERTSMLLHKVFSTMRENGTIK